MAYLLVQHVTSFFIDVQNDKAQDEVNKKIFDGSLDSILMLKNYI